MVMQQLLQTSVHDASQRPEVLSAVDALYARVQAEIDQRRPVCAISGRCCRFEEYGHRLYVTTIELARFVHALGPIASPPDWDGTGCPFQRSKLCIVHSIRPFGCRMFFCDATSTDWQNAAYERFHEELKQFHDRFNVPYFYVEWREALKALERVAIDRLPSVRQEGSHP